MKPVAKAIPRILEYGKEWRDLLPDATDKAIAELAVSSFSLRSTPHEYITAHGKGRNAEEIAADLFELNLAAVRDSLRPGRPTVAMYLHEHAPLYNQQQIYLLKALKKDARYNTVVISSVEPHPIENFDLDPAWFDVPVLRLPDTSKLEGFDWIDVIIALDFCACKPIRFPKRAKRINQVHGTDIKFQYSVEFYGAGMLFDYLLAPSFAPEILTDDYRTRYRNVFPRALIDHQSRELRIIPFGSPKLDEFIKVAEGKPKSDIIYNLSLWGLETAFVQTNLKKTIKLLLEEFPDRRLVFRCFPGQQEIIDPYIEEFRSNPRFFVSTASSYVSDYSCGAVLVYHRGSSSEIFALSTGSPIIRFDGHDTGGTGVTTTDLGYIVRTHDQLVQTVRTVLGEPDHRRDQILAYRSSILPYAGRSIGYLLDCIEKIVADDPLPEWKRVLLYDLSEDETLTNERVRRSAEICERNNYLIPLLASSCADAFPEDAVLQYAAAKAIFEHIYPGERVRDPWILGLEYVVRLLKQTGVPPAKGGDSQFVERATKWLMTVFPERFTALIGFAMKHSTPDEIRTLKALLAQLPLEPLDPQGIPQMMRDNRDQPAREDAAPRLLHELTETRARLGIELLHQGKYVDAEAVLREAQKARPDSVPILFLMAHALKGQQRYGECAQLLELLLRIQPGLEDVQELYREVQAQLQAARR